MEKNFTNLLEAVKSYEVQFEISTRRTERFNEITMQEIAGAKQDKKKAWKCLRVRVCDEPASYSIILFAKEGESTYKFKSEINTKGSNDFLRIKQDIDDLISGKKGKPHDHSIPF